MYVTWVKIFECIVHYGDQLLITENVEEPVGITEESETGSPGSCWALCRCVVPLESVEHTKGNVHVCVCPCRMVAGAAVSLLIRFCSLKLCTTCTNPVCSHSLTTFANFCSFYSPAFLCTENVFQESDGFSVIGKSPIILKYHFLHASSKAGQNARSLEVFECRVWFCSSQR